MKWHARQVGHFRHARRTSKLLWIKNRSDRRRQHASPVCAFHGIQAGLYLGPKPMIYMKEFDRRQSVGIGVALYDGGPAHGAHGTRLSRCTWGVLRDPTTKG